MGRLTLRCLGTAAVLAGLYALIFELGHPPLSALGAMAGTYALVKLWQN